MASSINAAALSRSFARVGAFRQAKEVADRADSNDRLVGYSVILMEYALLSNSGMRSVGG
jgi:hypothetical protein